MQNFKTRKLIEQTELDEEIFTKKSNDVLR